MSANDQSIIFYHRTDAAESILRDGFRDNNGLVGAQYAGIEGVFLSNRPLDCNEGAKGDQLLEVTLPSACDLSDYEIIDEENTSYREWCVPAEVINQHGKVRLLSADEEDQIDSFPYFPQINGQ